MKRAVLFLMMVLTVSFTFAHDQEEGSKTTEAERIIDKYGGQIVDGFNNVIENVTPYAEEGFKMVVKLKMAEGIVHLILAAIALTLFILILRHYKGWIYDNDCEVGSIFMGVICLVYFPIGLYWGIVMVVAPEWFAIKELIRLF